MIEKLRKQVKDIEKALDEKKKELKEAIMIEDMEKLKPFLHKCCRIKSHATIAYLINVSEIGIDEYDDNFIDISAEKVIIIETDLPSVNLDEETFMYNSGIDVIEAMTEDKIWEVIGKDIKSCLG